MVLATRALALFAAAAMLSPLAMGSEIWFVNQTATGASTGQTWQDAFTDLQDALAVAQPGDQVWVAAGTYTPDGGTGQDELSFALRPDVSLFGGFGGTESALEERDVATHVTVLSGDLAGNDTPATFKNGQTISDNADHVVTAIDVGPMSLLDGVTITGGTGGSLLGGCSENSAAGGLAIIDASPSIRSCTLLLNRANQGGACAVTGLSSPSFYQCAFVGNFSKGDGPGAIWVCAAAISLEDCRFVDNGFNINNSGGAISIGNSDVVIRGCEFINNQSNWTGGAVDVLGGTKILIEGTLFLGNRAYLGAALHAESFSFQFDNDVTLRNSVFSGNESLGSYGGAIWIKTSAAVIENCTIVGNRSYFTSLGAGIAVEGLSPEVILRNTIVWGNSADRDLGEISQIWDGMEFFDVKVESACIQGLGPIFEGNGNIGDDPLLVNPAGPDGTAGTPDDDLRLSPGSPCIDAGDLTSSGIGLDIGGMPRRLDGNLDTVAIVDIGAHEFGNVQLNVGGDFVAGGAVTVTVDSAVPLFGYLIVARSPGWEVLEPFGPALFDLDGSWIRVSLGVLPFEQAFSVPSAVPAAFDLTLQAFGIHPFSGAGNMSNAVELPVAP